MQFTINRDILLKSLNYVQGIVEKKNTLPILSNVLIKAENKSLHIIATDLDIVFYDEISDLKIEREGTTTTTAAVLFDILRKISPSSSISFNLVSSNKLSLKAENSDFNLLCLPVDNFPSYNDDFKSIKTNINSKKLLSLLNKTKIAISNDDTRHYLNGIFLHITESNGKVYLSGVATDSHRLSYSSTEIGQIEDFNSLILPKKTVYQLCSLLSEINEEVVIQVSENKIKFEIAKTKLISKVIDGKFPDYQKVVPIDNKKNLMVSSKEFIDSIERVITVSLDKKEGVKMDITKNKVKLSVNSTNSGEGNEDIDADYQHDDLSISFNSKYLIDIASEIEDNKLKMNLKDSSSPVLIQDNSDKNSYYVIMPMKI